MIWEYSAHDSARIVTEKRKTSARTDFERDRARVLHSSALRRLGAKTQVLGPGSDDFVRTRLTHSLEVAQVGRTLGQELGCDPDVVDTACLAHDLGHPPFGHNGERALAEISQSIGGFEGNAQTFRLLVRLEPKGIAADGQHVGLNLTRASLDAVSKYPWQSGSGPNPEKSRKKFGVYLDDLEYFSWVREDAPEHKRCLEAQVMDLSDDIGYSVHDIEDAISTYYCDLSLLSNEDVRQEIYDSTRTWYGSEVSDDDLNMAWERLRKEDYWLDSFAGSYEDSARLKDMTSNLIGRFCSAAHDATRNAFGQGPLGRYSAELVVPQETMAEITLLKGIAVHYVMAPREHEPVYLRQRTLIFDLVDALLERRGKDLEDPFKEAYFHSAEEGEGLRAVVDQVASLTDTSAHRWHARLCGAYSVV